MPKLLIAWPVMAVCVTIHAAGMASALRWVSRRSGKMRDVAKIWMFVQVAGWIIMLHLAEIAVWALLYVLGNAIGDLASALYFSAVTYTTTGYGDVVLPQGWRLVGAVEALTGILMCGWSTAFFFQMFHSVSRSVSDGPGN